MRRGKRGIENLIFPMASRSPSENEQKHLLETGRGKLAWNAASLLTAYQEFSFLASLTGTLPSSEGRPE